MLHPRYPHYAPKQKYHNQYSFRIRSSKIFSLANGSMNCWTFSFNTKLEGVDKMLLLKNL